MATRKTIYHSQLGEPSRVSVESDALVSKFAPKKGLTEDSPGYYYLFIKLDGVDHTYSAENKRSAQTLSALKGKGEHTIQAHGRDSEAWIEVKGVSEKPQNAPPQSQESKTAPPEGASEEEKTKKVRDQFTRMADLYIIALEFGALVRSQWDLEHKDDPMPVEQFQAAVSWFAITADRHGLVDQLP